MSDIERRAVEARTLLSEQSALPAVLEEIRQEAVAAFLSSGGDPERMAAAFDKVRAVETLRHALRQRENALTVEEHQKRKEQQRGND